MSYALIVRSSLLLSSAVAVQVFAQTVVPVENTSVPLIPAPTAAPTQPVPVVPPQVPEKMSQATLVAPIQPQAVIEIVGTVLEIRGRKAVLSLGSKNGLKLGDTVELYEVQRFELDIGPAAEEATTLAVAKITLLTEDRSVVELGLHENVPVGSRVRSAEKKAVTAELMAPPRASGFTEFSASLRPFFALGTSGTGTYSDVVFGHRFKETPLHLQVRADPVTFGAYDEGVSFAGSGAALASYDSKWVEVGLGIGVGSASIWSDTEGEYVCGSNYENCHYEYPDLNRAVLVIPQIFRVGSLDGTSGEIVNTVILDHGRFEYGGLKLSGRYRVADNIWIVGRIQGTQSVGMGEIGLRFLATGVGGPGSLFLTPTFGGAALPPDRDKNVDSHGGPHLGLEAEWRL